MKVRIIQEPSGYYSIQVKRWWLPVWRDIPAESSRSKEEAMQRAARIAFPEIIRVK